MSNNIFPIQLRATKPYTWVNNPRLAEMVWLRLRKDFKDLTWYAVDIDLLSINSATLYVRDMADAFYGGIGEVILEISVTDFTEDEYKEIVKIQLREYTRAAEEEFEKRQEQERLEKIQAIRIELFGI